MVEIGTIKCGFEIGYKGRYKYIWSACAYCGKERWVFLHHGLPTSNRCLQCAGVARIGKYLAEESPNWKGGRSISKQGYVDLYIRNDDFYFPMVHKYTRKGGYVSEHRLVMAKHLGRCLQRKEIVHHFNGVRSDNGLENLGLVTLNNHQHNTLVKMFRKRIRDLEGQLSQKRFIPLPPSTTSAPYTLPRSVSLTRSDKATHNVGPHRPGTQAEPTCLK